MICATGIKVHYFLKVQPSSDYQLRPFLQHIKNAERKRMREMEKEEAPRTPAPRVKQEPKAAPRSRR
jgi:hypothetical protein